MPTTFEMVMAMPLDTRDDYAAFDSAVRRFVHSLTPDDQCTALIEKTQAAQTWICRLDAMTLEELV